MEHKGALYGATYSLAMKPLERDGGNYDFLYETETDQAK